MLQCNLKYEENLDEEKFDALIARLRQDAADGKSAHEVVQKSLSYAKVP